MAVSIGPKGHVDISTAGSGPQRKVRLVSFYGRSDTGFISQPILRAGENPIAVPSDPSSKQSSAPTGRQ
jgi:hypothetical protein